MPQLSEEFVGVTAVACSSDHSGFVVDGSLYTVGSNKYGQLGQESDGSDPAHVPIEAEDGHRPAVVAAAFGPYHSAAITEGGALWTWGWGGSFWGGAGALGHGTTDAQASPTLVERFVEFGEEVRQVTVGRQHTVVLTDQGRVYSTGKGEYGRLGRGEHRDEIDFEEIEYFSTAGESVLNPNAATNIAKVDCGSNFSAAMSTTGEIWLWGQNDFGQIGVGIHAMQDRNSCSRYPRLIRTLPLEGHFIVDFACGEHHVVALTSAGAIYEWGNRRFWEPQPVTLPSRYEAGLQNVSRVFAGDRTSFALTTDGRLYSWGARQAGCLAQGPDCPEVLEEPKLIDPETFAGQPVLDMVASRGTCLAITFEE